MAVCRRVPARTATRRGGLTHRSTAAVAATPAWCAAAGGTLWLVYDRYGKIWYRTSIDYGVNWTAETQLPTDERDVSDPVVLQVADGNLWVVWHGYRLMKSMVVVWEETGLWYKTSADGGATWSADTQLSAGDLPHRHDDVGRSAGGGL